MSVVKKYQLGGQIRKGFKDYALEQLSEESFTPEAFASAKEAISLFDKLAQEDNINEIFIVDPKQGKYTINIDKIKNPDLKTIDWNGSSIPGKKNFFGVYTGKDIRGEEGSGKRKYMGLIAGMLNNYYKTNNAVMPKQSNVFKLDSFNNYIVKNKFNGASLPFESLLSENSSNEDRQKLLINLSKEFLNDYINQSNRTDQNPAEYKDLTLAKEVLSKLNDPNINFDQARQAVTALGWNLKDESYFEAPEDVETKKAKEIAAKNEAARSQFEAGLLSKGIPKQVIDKWYADGWTKVLSGLPETIVDPEVTNWFNSTGGFRLSNEDGSITELLSPKGEILSSKVFDLSSPLYGTYLGKDALGNIIHYKPGIEGYKNPDNDPIQGKGFRGISGLINGQERTMYGIPTKIGNKIDYTSRLQIEDSTGNDYMEIYKDADGVYKDENGNPIDVKLFNFNEENRVPMANLDSKTSYYDIINNLNNDAFKNIPKGTDLNFEVLQKAYASLMQQGSSSKNIGEWTKLVSRLKYKLSDAKNFKEREKASEMYYNLLNQPNVTKYIGSPQATPMETTIEKPSIWDEIFFTKKAEEYSKWLKGQKSAIGALKKGGVIKAQSGLKIDPAKKVSWEEYNTKINSNAPAPTEQVKDWRGRLKDMSELEKLSLATSLGSVVPGIGTASGLATLGIDIARKIKGEDVSAMDLGADAAFAALSLVGLGGIGAASRMGKAAVRSAKIAELTGIKAGEFATKEAAKFAAKETEKLAKSTVKSGLQKLMSVTDATKTPRQLGITKEELSALKRLKIVKENTNITTVFKKGTQTELKEKATQLLTKDRYVPKVYEGSEQAIKDAKMLEKSVPTETIINKSLLENINPKVATAIQYGLLAPSAIAVPGVIADVSEGGIENIKSDDLSKMVFTAAGVKGLLKNKKLANNIKSLIEEGKESKSLLIKGKKYDVDLEVPKMQKVPTTKFYSRTKAKEKVKEEANKIIKENKEALDKFKSDFKTKTSTDLGDIGFADIIEQNSPKFTFKTSKVNPKTGAVMNEKDYAKAMKAINSANPLNYFNSWKKGGIIKAENGTKAEGRLMKQNPFTYKDVLKQIDPLMIVNIAKLARSNKANNDIIKEAIKANEASYYHTPLSPKVNVPTQVPVNFIYENAAASNRLEGRRIANSISDINKSIYARLGAEKNATENTIKGDLINKEAIYKNRLAQAEYDYKTNLTNQQVDATNRANAAKVASQRWSIFAQGNQAKAGQMDQFLTSIGFSMEAKRLKEERKEALEKYYSGVDTSEYQTDLNRYNEMYSPAAEEALRKQVESEETAKGFKTHSDWTTHEKKLDFDARKKKAEEELLNKQTDLQRKMMAYRLGVSELKKGGTLKEKIFLENMRAENKLILERQKYYQNILSNNNKVRSSLLSLFK